MTVRATVMKKLQTKANCLESYNTSKPQHNFFHWIALFMWSQSDKNVVSEYSLFVSVYCFHFLGFKQHLNFCNRNYKPDDYFLLSPFTFNIKMNSVSNCLQSLSVTTLYFLYSTFQVGDKLLDFCVTGMFFLLSTGIQLIADFWFHTEDLCHEVDLSHDKKNF